MPREFLKPRPQRAENYNREPRPKSRQMERVEDRMMRRATNRDLKHYSEEEAHGALAR